MAEQVVAGYKQEDQAAQPRLEGDKQSVDRRANNSYLDNHKGDNKGKDEYKDNDALDNNSDRQNPRKCLYFDQNNQNDRMIRKY